MKSTVLQLKKIIKSKSLYEMLDNLPWSYVYFLAFIPLFLFTILPLFQLIGDFLNPGAFFGSYYGRVKSVHAGSAISGLLAIFFWLLKTKRERVPLKTLLKENVPMLFFLVFIAAIIVSTAVNGLDKTAMKGHYYRGESVFYFLEYFTIYFLCGSIMRSSVFKKIVLYTHISVGTIIAVIGIIDNLVTPVYAISNQTGPAVIFFQFNHYGYYLLTVILISAALFAGEKEKKLRLVCLAAFVINTVMLVINNTFGCFLACFVALIFQCVLFSVRGKKLNLSSLAALGIFIAISLIMSIWYDTVFNNILTFFTDVAKVAVQSENADSAGTGRWALWKYTAGYISERPLLGFGTDGTADRLEIDGGISRPHNELLQYASFYGIPAALIYVFGVTLVFIRGLKKDTSLGKYTSAALVAAFGYFISSFFGNTMFYTAPFFFIFLGMGSGSDERDKK